MDVYSSDICRSPKVEQTQMSIWRQMGKLNIIYPYSEILLSEILIHAITWKNLENMLSERSQSSKFTYYMIPLYNCIHTKIQSREIYKERKYIMVVWDRLVVESTGKLLYKVYWGFFRWPKFLKLTVMVHISVNIIKITELNTLKGWIVWYMYYISELF